VRRLDTPKGVCLPLLGCQSVCCLWVSFKSWLSPVCVGSCMWHTQVAVGLPLSENKHTTPADLAGDSCMVVCGMCRWLLDWPANPYCTQ
jgi:hypothetical protein